MSRFLVICMLLILPVAVLSNNQSIIEIEAQTVIIKEKEGISVYSGGAILKRAGLNIAGETIEISTNNKKVVKVVAKGSIKKRAYYTQNKGKKQNFIRAQAINITYLAAQNIMHLRGDAQIIQGSNKFNADFFTYDITNDKILASQVEGSKEKVKFKIEL